MSYQPHYQPSPPPPARPWWLLGILGCFLLPCVGMSGCLVLGQLAYRTHPPHLDPIPPYTRAEIVRWNEDGTAWVLCRACRGSGRDPLHPGQPCGACSGLGTWLERDIRLLPRH